MALQANAAGAYDLGAALLELARMVLLERERAAAAALRLLSTRG